MITTASSSVTATRRAAVWQLMIDGRWHTTMEINDVDVGGSEGCRRLRELRQEVRLGKRRPWARIEKRKAHGDTTQYEYRLVKLVSEPPEKKGQQSLW